MTLAYHLTKTILDIFLNPQTKTPRMCRFEFSVVYYSHSGNPFSYTCFVSVTSYYHKSIHHIHKLVDILHKWRHLIFRLIYTTFIIIASPISQPNKKNNVRCLVIKIYLYMHLTSSYSISISCFSLFVEIRQNYFFFLM